MKINPKPIQAAGTFRKLGSGGAIATTVAVEAKGAEQIKRRRSR